ncbi:unnamed protein product, partial [Adineta steineri]
MEQAFAQNLMQAAQAVEQQVDDELNRLEKYK